MRQAIKEFIIEAMTKSLNIWEHYFRLSVENSNL